MKYEELIPRIESEWDQEVGALGLTRVGQYDSRKAKDLIDFLRSIKSKDSEFFPRRFVSLIWYMPLFLGWQSNRVEESGTDVNEYSRFINQVEDEVSQILGVP